MTLRRWIAASSFRIGLLLLLSAGATHAEQGQSAAGQSASNSPSSSYVGAHTCKTCHSDLYSKHFEGTRHFALVKEGKHGCEDCHGPGSAHVEGGGDISKIVSFKNLSREQASTRCLSCHGTAQEQAHFRQSPHANSEVGCLDCHSPHYAKEPQHLLAQKQPQLCYGCHTSARADFGKPYHHRVDEGLVQCSDCHNPHGTTNLRQVRALPSGDQVCYKCHADKQGPFVYEHVPVKTEGCQSCHSPHGSTNPRMLRVSTVNLLCLQCHTYPTVGPGGGHNQSDKHQACTLCHVAIHGSNASSRFTR